MAGETKTPEVIKYCNSCKLSGLCRFQTDKVPEHDCYLWESKAGTEVNIIYWKDIPGDYRKVQNTVWGGFCPNGIRIDATVTWIGLYAGKVIVSFDKPVRVSPDGTPECFDIRIDPLPDKRCGNCKHSYEGGCSNCAGDNFGSFTEIVSWANGCENWEEEEKAGN
jgi:hypothetical protein